MASYCPETEEEFYQYVNEYSEAYGRYERDATYDVDNLMKSLSDINGMTVAVFINPQQIEAL